MATKKRAKKSEINYGYDSAFPSVLRILLQEHTQEELAQSVGVKRQAIAQWKDGKTKPDVYYLSLIADFFDVTTDYLLGKTNVKKADTSLRMACEYTGLSEKAVDALKNKQNSGESVLCRFISFLLCNEFVDTFDYNIQQCAAYKLIDRLYSEEEDSTHSRKICGMDGEDFQEFHDSVLACGMAIVERSDAIKFFRSDAAELVSEVVEQFAEIDSYEKYKSIIEHYVQEAPDGDD